MDSENSVVLDAVLTDKKELAYTPAGVAVFEARFLYAGEQFEAGATRRVEFDFTAMAFADAAARLSRVPLGERMLLKGFLSQRSLRNTKLTVHIMEFKIRS